VRLPRAPYPAGRSQPDPPVPGSKESDVGTSLSGIETAIWGILTFSILIVMHELGHFLTARALGVKVHEFMLGLPGPALRLRTKNMTWGITAIPLGGYVRIAGMGPGAEDRLLAPALLRLRDAGPASAPSLAVVLGVDEERAESLLATLEDWKAAREGDDGHYEYTLESGHDTLDGSSLLDQARRFTYRGQSTPRKIAILSMGVVTNIVVALVTFTVVLSVWGFYDPTTTIESLGDGTPAAAAGIVPGDTLAALDGEAIETWTEFQMLMAQTEPGETVTVSVDRDGSVMDITATLADQDGHGYLGVGPAFVHVRPSVWASFKEALRYTGLTVQAILSLLNPATFSATVGNLTGVVGISVMAAQAVASGPIDYAALIAMLSLSLGLMNLIPLPPLDGGKIVLEIVARVIRRPIKPAVTVALNAAGSILLFGLVGYIIFVDIARIVGQGVQ